MLYVDEWDAEDDDGDQIEGESVKFEIDPAKWYTGELKPKVRIILPVPVYTLSFTKFTHHSLHPSAIILTLLQVVGELGEIQDSIPHNNLTHLILTNNIYRLQKEMGKMIPTGLLLLHGGVSATKYFCNSIQQGSPVFLFKVSVRILYVEMQY